MTPLLNFIRYMSAPLPVILRKSKGDLAKALAYIAWTLYVPAICAQDTHHHAKPAEESSLWSHDNLFAWCVEPWDTRKRGHQERARMLSRLGFKSFAYISLEHDDLVTRSDAEIEALQAQSINILAWWFPYEAADPNAKVILETFRRHRIHPQLWVMQSLRESPEPPHEEVHRVEREANRIRALAQLAAPYGSRIELYNHNGWFGMMNNEVAIIQQLNKWRVTDVGIVYNFSHARDELHDDTTHFPAIWREIQPYVVAVNITGTHSDGELIYPGQGDRELEMMRIIEESGWRGPIGLIAEKGGDAEVTLSNYLTGLDWLAAELRRPTGGIPLALPMFH